MTAKTSKFLACAALAGVLGGCMATGQPDPTAFQKNVGPGSTVGGAATDSRGSANSGIAPVPGVSSAGNVSK